jgi:hypothetical protein
MKFSREVMPLEVTSTLHLLIPYLQAFQISEVDAKLALVNVGT